MDGIKDINQEKSQPEYGSQGIFTNWSTTFRNNGITILAIGLFAYLVLALSFKLFKIIISFLYAVDGGRRIDLSKKFRRAHQQSASTTKITDDNLREKKEEGSSEDNKVKTQ